MSNNGSWGLINEELPVRANLSLTEVEKQDRLNKERPPQKLSFEGWLLKYYSDITTRDIVGERSRYYQMFLAQEFYQCRQYGFWRNGVYTSPDPNKDSLYYQIDYYSPQVRALLTQWCAAEIKLRAIPAETSARGQASSRAADVMMAYYQRQFQTPTREQGNGLRGILQGGYMFYTFFDPEAKSGGKYKIPVYGEKAVPNPGQMWECLSCGSGGLSSELPNAFPQSYQSNPIPGQEEMEGLMPPSPANELHEQAETPVQETLETLGGQKLCPECQMPVNMIGPDQTTELTVDGYEEGEKGEVVSIDVDGLEVGLHPLARNCNPATTPWLYYRFRMHKAKLKSIYPWYKPSSGTIDKGLAYQRRLEAMLGSFTGGGDQIVGWSRNTVEDDTAVVTMVWLRNYTYCDYVYEEDTPLMSGEVIPAGTHARDKWPNGVLFIVVDNMVMDIHDQCIDDHWSGGAYWPALNNNWGLGAWSSIWQQRLVNDAYNFYIEAIKHTTATQRLYNANVLDGNMIGNDPSGLVPVTNIGPDGDLTKVMHFMAGPQPPQSIIQFIDRGRSDMQDSNGASPSLVGQVSANVSATDARQSKDAALANAALPTKIKGEVYAKRMEQTLRLVRKHLLFTRAFPAYLDGDYTRYEVQEFCGADIEVDIFITFAEYSAIPTWNTDRKNNFINALQNGAYNEQLKPEVRRRICEVFDEPYSANRQGAQRRKAEIRLTAIQSMLDGFYSFLSQDPMNAQMLLEPEITMQPDPVTGIPVPVAGMKRVVKEILTAPECAISIEFDDHNAMMEWCEDWGNSDRGIFADRLLYEIITARYHEHRNAGLQVEQALSAQAALSQQPAMQAAQSFPQLGGAAMPSNSMPPPQGRLTPTDPNQKE